MRRSRDDPAPRPVRLTIAFSLVQLAFVAVVLIGS